MGSASELHLEERRLQSYGTPCPICGNPASKKGCKPAPSLRDRGGWICGGFLGAEAQRTEENGHLCVQAGDQWSTWLPITSLNDANRRRPGESKKAHSKRKAAYIRQQTELAEAAAALAGADPTDTHRFDEEEPAWLHAPLPEEQQRIVLTAEQRHNGLHQLLRQIGSEPAGDRLLEVQQRLGINHGNAPANVWGVGAMPTEEEAELPRGWIEELIQLPVPGAMPAASGTGHKLLAPAGIWWPILGAGGQLLGIEVQADHWRRALWPDAPKYRPLSKESASARPGDRPSPFTWRVAVGLERLEPPMGIYGPRADGACTAQALAAARGLLLTEGRAVKPRISALRWGVPAVGGHGHASFGTVARQLDAVLQRLPADALVLLAPDAGGVSNAAVLEQLLRTAGRVVLQGRTPRVAWWGQTYKAAKEAGTSRPNLCQGDPDELLIDWIDGQPHARYWLVVSEELHQLGLAWHGAALAHGMGSEEEMAARELMLGPQPSRPSDGDTLEDLRIRQALRAAVKERSGLVELLCGGGVHLDSPQLELRHRELRTEQVIDRDGDLAWRWSVPGRVVELLGIEEWIERCVPETICRLRTGEDPDLEGSYEEWPAREQLLQQWREGQALRAAGGGRIPPLPPRWGKATAYGPDGRDEAWREALMGLRQGQEQVLAAALRRWAAADGLTPEELTAATEAVMSEPEWLRPGERRDALVERAALTEALRRHYSQQPYAERGRQALLIADPTGSGKSHRWAQIATRLAKEQGLIGVLWLAKDYRSAVVEPLRDATRDLPPTRHNGLFRNAEGKVRERGPDEDGPPPGWSWADSPTCQMSHDLARQRARGHSNAAIDDWCNNVCHLRGGCPYHQTKEHFWAMRGSESGRMPLIGKSENVGGRWIKPRPDFVRASMAMVQPFEALAYGWLKRLLVVVDEADHLLASCTATHKLKGHHLAALQLQLARSALERKQAGDAEAAAQLESVAELLVVLIELCSSKAIGRHGLSPRQLQEHPLMAGWLKGAEAAGLPAVLMQTEEMSRQELLTTALFTPGALDPLGLQALNKALDQEGLQVGMASPEADLCPPLLLELIRGALGDAVHRGSTVLSLEAVRQPKGTKAAANAPRFAVAITRPTGVGHTLASTAGALVVLDATSAPELIERALNATAGRTDHRSTPIGLRTLQLQSADPTDTHRSDPMEELLPIGKPAAQQHPPVQILQVRDLGGLTRDRRDTFAAVREALLIEISDWLKATYGESEELGVIDHLKFCRPAEQGPLTKGIRQEQAWFTTGARGGNLLAGVRGLALLGLPVTNITASTSQALALADWSDPSAQPDELGVAIAEGQARSIGSELMQAIGRPRWNRQPKGWGPAVLIVIGDGDLSALLPAIPGRKPSEATDTHRSGIREIGAEWFGEQLGRGAEGLVARARAQRKGKTTEARVAGKAQAGSKTTEQAAAIREQICDVIVGHVLEAKEAGRNPLTALQWCTARGIGNQIGSTAPTVRKHLLAMASAVDPAIKARGAAVLPVEAAEALILYEARRNRPKAA